LWHGVGALYVYICMFTFTFIGCCTCISFSQGDTLQNVAKELECIVDTGIYIFTLTSDASGGKAEVMLEYVPSTDSAVLNATSMEEGGTPRTLPRSTSYPESGTGLNAAKRVESWSQEQINDFVRKLGFLDTQKEGGAKIKHFLHINEVCLRAP